MARPRGRRTEHVTVYLSTAEAEAWDVLRSLQQGSGWAGAASPSRATWIMERACAELEQLLDGRGMEWQRRSAAALDVLRDEGRRLGDPDVARSHGRIRSTQGPGH